MTCTVYEYIFMHAANAHAYPSRDQTSSKTHEARGECSMQDISKTTGTAHPLELVRRGNRSRDLGRDLQEIGWTQGLRVAPSPERAMVFSEHVHGIIMLHEATCSLQLGHILMIFSYNIL